jgi:hypothetical protein
MDEVASAKIAPIKQFFLKRIVSSKIFYFVLGILIILVVFLLSALSYSPSPQKYHYEFCGDGTFSSQCSLTKPYLCVNQTLVENDSYCGCPDNFQFNGTACESKYDNLSKNLVFNYLLDGVNRSLDFRFRNSVLNYLLNLSPYKVYPVNETPRLSDLKLAKIDNPVQSSFLMPLVIKIENLYPNSKDMQAKAAVSFVQDIPYSNQSNFALFFGTKVEVGKYPYQVLGDDNGSCESKSELLAYMLKQMGFGVVLFYFPSEDHESVGIKCPVEYSYLGTGYCFIETTMPSPISFSEGLYLGDNGVERLSSTPQIIMVSNGISLSGNISDYSDAKLLGSLSNQIINSGSLNPLQESQMSSLRKKYGLNY